MTHALHRLDLATIATADDLRGVLGTLRTALTTPSLLVVGPFDGVEALLSGVVRRARARDDGYRTDLDALGRWHLSLAEALLPATWSVPLALQLQEDTRDLADTCHALRSGGDAGVATALALSCGSLWSSRIVDACLREAGVDARWCDAIDLLHVDAPDSRRALAVTDGRDAAWRAATEACIVIPGGRALDAQEKPVHLRPHGLDRGAALLATLLVVQDVTLWHPAAPGGRLTVAQASALADLDPAIGAPAVWVAVLADGIPVRFRRPGDQVRGELLLEGPDPQGVTVRWRHDVTLLIVAGEALAELPHGLRTLAQCLVDVDAPALLLGMGAPAEPLTAVLPRERADAALERVRKAFLWEDRARHAQWVQRHDDVTLLRLVGSPGLLAGPGLLAAVYGAIHRAHGEVVALAQPAGGSSLSAVVRTADAAALEAVLREVPGLTV